MKFVILLCFFISTCTALSCNMMDGGDDLKDGSISCSGDTCTFTCNSYAQLIGPQQRTCNRQTGEWSDTMPICDIDLTMCKKVVDGRRIKCTAYTQEQIDLLNTYFDRFASSKAAAASEELVEVITETERVAGRSPVLRCQNYFCQTFCWRLRGKKVQKKCRKCKKTQLKNVCVRSATLFG